MKKFNRKKISIITLISVFIGVTSNAYSAETIDASLPKSQVKSVQKEEQHKGDEHKSEEGHDEHSDHSETKEHDEHDEHREHNETKGHDGETEDKGHTESEEGITLSPEKMSIANIIVESILPKIHFNTVYAPGEIKVNGYKSYVVSPRTESVIIKRHAILGEHVNKGQNLVTLFSEAMAQAQADYLIASTEWQRVKSLGKQTISESRLLNAETTFNASYGRLFAFGLTDDAIKTISKSNTTSFGQYSLTAQRAGIVLSDDFSQGQRVAAGDEIMLLADENDLWVEAKVAASKKLNLSINSPAIVNLDGQDYKAKVIQEAHTIDPITRTRIVRLSVTNKDDNLHSGMFVKVNFQFETDTQVMAVPEDALIRGADGDWTVFVEDHPGEFNAIEVELGQTFGDYREIIGLNSGSRVVTKGAFFVASEIAKGGFDPHNH
ncbi:efflux RND transporter periplasmic adaptor subunit [Colwellia sp. 20A7]|uniref:efflux RND transporter periplasmic adaptor subunit n=1 Tax=Colwellia sp. 20A7 TaxID=2689569 RepID=UPI0013569432|nr:efflux RND transporter periplasmic adaptor subunit [Colwellia sp. 20A7]